LDGSEAVSRFDRIYHQVRGMALDATASADILHNAVAKLEVIT
jgi:hypothetical protein